jgi:hypothetical protein
MGYKLYRLLAILIFLGFSWGARAQVLEPISMDFQIQFQPVGDDTNSPEFSGPAYFSNVVPDPYTSSFYYIFAVTDTLEFSEDLYTRPADILFLKKDKQGEVSVITTYTNFSDYTGTGDYYFDASVRLTKPQISALVSGELYLQIDFPTNSYLGRILPFSYDDNGHTNYVYLGPQAFFDFKTPNYRPISIGVTYITGRTPYADIDVSGDASLDPFYLPMSFSWSIYQGLRGGPLLFNRTGTSWRYNFAPGYYTLNLQARDRYGAGQWAYTTIVVETTQQSVNDMISNVQSGAYDNRTAQKFVAILQQASSYFGQNNWQAGCAQLKLFAGSLKPRQFPAYIYDYLVINTQNICATLGYKN